jgi:hypothetical protein
LDLEGLLSLIDINLHSTTTLLLDDDSICFNHTEVRLGGWVLPSHELRHGSKLVLQVLGIA